MPRDTIGLGANGIFAVNIGVQCSLKRAHPAYENVVSLNTELKQRIAALNNKVTKLRKAQPEVDRLVRLEEEHNSIRNRLR